MLEEVSLIFLSQDGQVRHLEQSTRELLCQYFPLSPSLKQDLPTTLQRWINYQISLINQKKILPSTRLPLQIETKQRRLIVRLVKQEQTNQYILLLEEQHSPHLCVQSLQWLGLSYREAEVLYWIAQARSTTDIANLMCIRVRTVKKHLEHIYQKFQVETRTAAVIYALRRLGIL